MEVTGQTKRIDPRQQFSKWLARAGSVFWISYLPLLAVIMCIRPETAIACVYMAIVVSVVRIFDVWAYTRNSTYEKALLALLDKTKMELSLKADSASVATENEEEEEKEEETEEESTGEESNG